MTYLQFHLVFTVPAVLALKLARPKVVASDAFKAGVALFTIALIAFVWTTPWDNYLVQLGVWGYGQERVLGTWGHVPFEEYFFFIIQPLLTGLWLYRLLWGGTMPGRRAPSAVARVVGSGLFLALSLLGVLLLRFESSLYLALILVWSCPLLMVQWIYGGHHLWRLRRVWFWATAAPTLYLWVADRIALALGIWHISEVYTVGVALLGLPLEEALFFVVTNLLVVQGLLLMLHTWRVEAVVQHGAAPRRQPRTRTGAGAA